MWNGVDKIRQNVKPQNKLVINGKKFVRIDKPNMKEIGKNRKYRVRRRRLITR